MHFHSRRGMSQQGVNATKPAFRLPCPEPYLYYRHSITLHQCWANAFTYWNATWRESRGATGGSGDGFLLHVSLLHQYYIQARIYMFISKMMWFEHLVDHFPASTTLLDLLLACSSFLHREGFCLFICLFVLNS